jgi:aquaporin Z
VAAHFIGGIAGVALAAGVWGAALAHPDVRYVVTQPGPAGAGPAFLAEALLTFVLFSTVVRVANSPRWSRWAGLCAALLLVLYITVEAPISGMSLNPARTLGSAAAAMDARALWVYFIAPPLGMLLAAELFRRRRDGRPFCARLQPGSPVRCLFCQTTH